MFGYGWSPNMESLIWVPGTHGHVPQHAVGGCRDIDGSELYIGRAYHEGDMLPAKISPTHGVAYVCHGGTEHRKTVYEVLCSNRVAWQSAKNGQVPPNAIEVGYTSSGEKLYAGRTMHEGSMTPGKIQPSHGVLYIPFGGEEKHYSEYEVLVQI